MRSSGLGAIALACNLLLGCALTDKGEPLTLRYFTPERIANTGGAEQANAGRALISAGETPIALRLGRVDSASYLREYMAFRDSELELGFYDDRRWTERPDAYLRRALEHALFEQRGLQRSTANFTPELRVELLAFDEVRKPRPGVLVQVKALLIDGRTAQLEESFVVEAPLGDKPAGDAPAQVAEGLALALDRAVQRVADRVLTVLRARTAEVEAKAAAQTAGGG
jgi:cholesterol transport system auxiliary component